MARFQIRDMLTGPTLAPPWLCGYDTNAQKFMYAIGLAFDVLLDKHVQAMAAKLPGQADDSAIPFQASDRLLIQGPAEPNAQFVERMRTVFDTYKIWGSRRAVLEQLQAYMTGLQPGVSLSFPEMTIVGGNLDSSIWDTVYLGDELGERAHSLVDPANWDWDGQLKPWRSWLVLFMHLVATGTSGTTGSISSSGGSGAPGVTTGFVTMTGLSGITAADKQRYITVSGAATSANNGTFQIVAVLSGTQIIAANPLGGVDANNGALVWSISEYPYIGPAPVWGSQDALWGTTNTWGVNVSELVITSIRQIVKQWKSGTTYYPYIIVAFGGGDGTAGNDFSPLGTPGAGLPDGTFGDMGKLVNGVWVPANYTTITHQGTAYCDGTGRAVQCYEKAYG